MDAPQPPKSEPNLEHYDLRKRSLWARIASAFDWGALLFHFGMPACVGLAVALFSSAFLGGVAAFGTLLGLLNFHFSSFVSKRSRSQNALTCTDHAAETVNLINARLIELDSQRSSADGDGRSRIDGEIAFYDMQQRIWLERSFVIDIATTYQPIQLPAYSTLGPAAS